MELILVRHAEPVREHRPEGGSDPGLSELGEQQAELLGSYLAEEGVDTLYASPMRRAYRTAEHVARATSLEIVVDDDLVEFDHGAPEYIPVEDAPADDDRYRRVLEGDLSPWGVDAEAFQKRVVAAVERIVVAHPGGRVAVVCHGGVVNAYLAHVLETPRVLFFAAHYTSVHRVLASRDGRRMVASVNEIAHLRGRDLLRRPR